MECGGGGGGDREQMGVGVGANIALIYAVNEIKAINSSPVDATPFAGENAGALRFGAFIARCSHTQESL